MEIEEADECCYWLEVIIDSEILPKARLTGLLKEANELTAIFVATLKTSSINHKS
jgi:hypothetical protein